MSISQCAKPKQETSWVRSCPLGFFVYKLCKIPGAHSHQGFRRPWSKSWITGRCSYLKRNDPIMSQFCTCPDSSAVVTCAKFVTWLGHQNHVCNNDNFYKSFVKWVPGLLPKHLCTHLHVRNAQCMPDRAELIKGTGRSIQGWWPLTLPAPNLRVPGNSHYTAETQITNVLNLKTLMHLKWKWDTIAENLEL